MSGSPIFIGTLRRWPKIAECTAAGKNPKTMCSKEDLETIPESKEPNESLQLDFWGPINYLKESRMYVIVAEWFAERQWFAEIIARIKF